MKSVVGLMQMKEDFKIGDTTIHAIVHRKHVDQPTMLNVHDDENTAVEAGKVSLIDDGGRIIELVHSGKRLITFTLGETNYTFDPNRIFSDPGIIATLKRHGSYSEEAHKEIAAFANQYLNRFRLDQEPVIIALHNVSDKTFSIESFAAGGWLCAGIAEIHINPSHSKFDFFFVTDKRFHTYLKERDFNVVLQDNDQVPDDGSLSVYFAHKNIPYINVEAEMGHLESQIEMLKAVRGMLRTLRLENYRDFDL
ncbi:hypothetical protein [Pedosphaera parvula]|nr:hypothetical protein [Pedosphaera parvula]